MMSRRARKELVVPEGLSEPDLKGNQVTLILFQSRGIQLVFGLSFSKLHACARKTYWILNQNEIRNIPSLSVFVCVVPKWTRYCDLRPVKTPLLFTVILIPLYFSVLIFYSIWRCAYDISLEWTEANQNIYSRPNFVIHVCERRFIAIARPDGLLQEFVISNKRPSIESNHH